MISVALPKGRLGEKVYGMFAAAGLAVSEGGEDDRRLVYENTEKAIRFFWVKPQDVAIYVERGAADIGVAGKDILMEYGPDVYELADLDTGKCYMAVAAPADWTDLGGTLRVATKYPGIAAEYFSSKDRDIDVIKLNGSIEIAPVLGLSDVIVDIVETGRTLKENGLEVRERICPLSARLIANKASYKFRSRRINDISKALEKAKEGRK